VFDLRYHVASLAAVFFALVIGILVGVALASHGLGNTERKRLEDDLKRAQGRGDLLQAKLTAKEESGALDSAFVERTYEFVLADRLKGKKIAILFVGSKDQQISSSIRRALSDAGAGEPLRVTALTIPIDPTKITEQLASRPFQKAYAGEDRLNVLGHALGQEFAAGAPTPLWNALQALIVEERDGKLKQPADGVVVVRTVPPQAGPTAPFLTGLYSGLKDVGVPAVGVEITEGDGSATDAFKKSGLSTVDDVDLKAGKLALVLLLSDPSVRDACEKRKQCSFGTKKSIADDGPLPKNIGPALTTTTGG
jgi:hypothetical protein